MQEVFARAALARPCLSCNLGKTGFKIIQTLLNALNAHNAHNGQCTMTWEENCNPEANRFQELLNALRCEAAKIHQ